MTAPSSSMLTLPVSARDHAKGHATALVTLVEYGDFQSPHCGRAYPIVEELRRQFGDRVRFVFRNFPLTQVHQFAELAAEAAEAAGAQDRFWEMHHKLFTHQSALDRSHLMHYAGEIGLDAARFAEALAAHSFKARVREDFMSGVRSGVNGTPTFFINGMRHDGPFDLSSLSGAVQDAADSRGE
jgi:protein-disulfide isomerase